MAFESGEAASESAAEAEAEAETVDGAMSKYAGYLLRVKPVHTDEGGVAAGFAVLSCPALVD